MAVSNAMVARINQLRDLVAKTERKLAKVPAAFGPAGYLEIHLPGIAGRDFTLKLRMLNIKDKPPGLFVQIISRQDPLELKPQLVPVLSLKNEVFINVAENIPLLVDRLESAERDIVKDIEEVNAKLSGYVGKGTVKAKRASSARATT